MSYSPSPFFLLPKLPKIVGKMNVLNLQELKSMLTTWCFHKALSEDCII